MMSNQEELVSRVDEYDNKLGLKPRSIFYDQDYIHRSVGILLFNSKNEILICKRSDDKNREPGVYSHSADGTVGDESYYQSGCRELEEELSLNESIVEGYKYYYEGENGLNKIWKTVYFCSSDKNFVIDKNEFQYCKRVSIEFLYTDLQKNPKNYALSFKKSMMVYKNILDNTKYSL